ncbi:hypothetical protein Dimus_021092 [Dionaea muscipula]
MHTIARKEFYTNLIVFIYKKKEIAKSRVKGVEIEFDSMKRPQLRMCLDTLLRREDGVWWVGTGENRRRDDDDEVPEEEVEEEEKDQTEFDWEAVIDEAAEQGEFGSDDQFFDAQVEVKEPVTETPAAPVIQAPSTDRQKVTKLREPTPRVPLGRIP